MTGLDPVRFEILWHKIAQLCEEMGINYLRCSGSPVIAYANDFNVGLTLPDGDLVAMGPFITTQSNVLPMLIRNTLRLRGREELQEDDLYISNDPYLGAAHQADVAIFGPVFYEGELVAWTASTGHQVDIGGKDPGGFSTAVVDVHQEGLRIPPVRLVERGELRRDLFAWILNQVRDGIVGLDLKAQIAANHVGRDRLRLLLEKYGPKTIRAVMEGAIAHAEERLRARLRELPDGRWEAVQHIDHDGYTELASRVRLALTKQGETLTFDFAGTDPQARGCINTTWAGLMAGVFTPVLVLLCHDIPWNQGVFNCVQVQADEGLLCNCRYPAPCSMATIAGTRLVANCGTLAISKMLSASPRYAREAMAVWAGSSQCPSLAGVSQHGYRFGFMEMSHHAGGGGARSFADGVDLGGVLQNATPSIPNVEATEHAYPLLYLFRRQLVDSGGPGRWRGGVSGEICYVPYDAPPGLSMVLVAYGVEVPNALGLWGGLPTCCVRWVRVRGTDIAERVRAGARLPLTLEEIPGEVQVFPAMHPRLPFVEGEAWYSNWQGGGGYGDPMDREPERVRRDVDNQLVSVACARSVYGVVITPGSGAVDMAGTAALRQQIRQERLARAASQGRLPAGRLRPAGGTLEASSLDPSGRTPAGLDPRGASGGGERVSFGPVLTVDRSSGLLLCRCGATLGAAGEGYKAGAAWEELPLTAAGPIRGEQYRGDRFILRCFYCPGCATLLETEVTLRGSPPLEDWLFGWPGAAAPPGASSPGGATAGPATGGGP